MTLNTNDFGDVKTLAILAQLTAAKAEMSATADSGSGNLVSGSTYLHGASMADFAVTCGNLTGITMWAPVQEECDLGTLANNIEQTLFLDEVYINSLEFSYSTGANATENYGAETDNKMWLMNDGAFVNFFTTVASGVSLFSGAEITFDFSTIGYDVTSTIPTLSTGNEAFLRKTTEGASAISYYTAATNVKTNYEVIQGTGAGSGDDEEKFVFNEADGMLYFPAAGSLTAAAVGDIVDLIYAADKYSTPSNTYFNLNAGNSNSDVGALRQGQVELYIADPDDATTSGLENVWRLSSCTMSADLTREPLTELGHLAPYDRPLTLPIPITITVDSTAGDLELWARFAGKSDEFAALTLDDIDLSDLMNKDNLCLVVKVYEQTDEEAGGTGTGRRVNTDSLLSEDYFLDGTLGTYAGTITGEVEYALKTVVVKNLKITDEGMTLDVGANATQTFGFRSNNDLFVVKGDLSYANVFDLARNVS